MAKFRRYGQVAKQIKEKQLNIFTFGNSVHQIEIVNVIRFKKNTDLSKMVHTAGRLASFNGATQPESKTSWQQTE